MARFALQTLGALCLILGIIGMLTPIPFGIIFLALSMMILIPTTPGVARVVQRMRRKSSRFDRMMAAAIRRAPAPYRRILRQTDVDVFYRSS